MAQVDFFLKIKGIDGEATDAKHKGEIDVESWSIGVQNSGESGSRGGLGSGKAVFQDFTFVMRVSKASPKLFEACSTGQHIADAVLTCRKAGGDQQEYLKYYFKEIIISSYLASGTAAGVVPMDTITFNYTEVQQEYKEQKADGSLAGSVKAGYHLGLNKKT